MKREKSLFLQYSKLLQQNIERNRMYTTTKIYVYMKNSEVMRSIVILTKYTEYVDMKGYELQL